jgi:hypothetical protein
VSSLLLSAMFIRISVQCVHAPSVAQAANTATAAQDYTSDAAAVEQPEQCGANSEQTEIQSCLF